MTSRPGGMFVKRMVNTEVRVYSTVSGENELASCGKIAGGSLDNQSNQFISQVLQGILEKSVGLIPGLCHLQSVE